MHTVESLKQNPLAESEAHDVIVGVPVAAHSEGAERLYTGVSVLSKSLLASEGRAAIYLYLNHPHSTTHDERALIERTMKGARIAAADLSVEGKVDVIPVAQDRSFDTIGALRRQLWTTVTDHQPDDAPAVCMSTDIDIIEATGQGDQPYFDAVRASMREKDVGMLMTDGSFQYAGSELYLMQRATRSVHLGEMTRNMYQTVKGVMSKKTFSVLKGETDYTLEDEAIQDLDVASYAVSLAYGVAQYSFPPEAALHFNKSLYWQAGGHDADDSESESINLLARMRQVQDLKQTPVEDGALAVFSFRRHMQQLVEGQGLGAVWTPEHNPFELRESYRASEELKELYLSFLGRFSADPVQILSQAIERFGDTVLDDGASAMPRYEELLAMKDAGEVAVYANWCRAMVDEYVSFLAWSEWQGYFGGRVASGAGSVERQSAFPYRLSQEVFSKVYKTDDKRIEDLFADMASRVMRTNADLTPADIHDNFDQIIKSGLMELPVLPRSEWC